MRLDVKEIQKQHIFGNKSFRAIGENLGVTKQYLSFICNDEKANSEKVFKELLDEFESTKNNYSVFDRIRIKRNSSLSSNNSISIFEAVRSGLNVDRG
jgi:alcohol dehydrogenase class IV